MLRALIIVLAFAGTVNAQTASEKAKSAFSAVKSECKCNACNCTDCKCTKDGCKCTDCNFEAIYAKCIKDGQIIVLEVGGVPFTFADSTLPWKVVRLKKLQGESPGYIVGVPVNGELHRLDFNLFTTRERIRLEVLHVIYPLTPGYIECPTCPTGRIWSGQSQLQTWLQNCVT